MLSALDTIVDGTPLWLECIRQVIRPPFLKHEELQVASRDISASSAQLTAFVKNQGLAAHGADTVVSSAEHLTKSSHTVRAAGHPAPACRLGLRDARAAASCRLGLRDARAAASCRPITCRAALACVTPL